MSARCRAIKKLDQVRCLAEFHQHLKECLEHPGATEPPKPLPYAVPLAIFAGECTPCYAVYGEVVDGLQEFTVVMPRLSPARLGRIKHSSKIDQSPSVIPVSMSGSLMPVTQ